MLQFDENVAPVLLVSNKKCQTVSQWKFDRQTERDVHDCCVLRCGTNFKSWNDRWSVMYATVSVKFNIPNSPFSNEFDPTTIYYKISWDYRKFERSIYVEDDSNMKKKE